MAPFDSNTSCRMASTIQTLHSTYCLQGVCAVDTFISPSALEFVRQNGAMVKRAQEEYLDHLAIQYGFLETSVEAFDSGKQGEAIRLATTLRVLLHQTKTSTSLVTHIERSSDLRFLNTAHARSPNAGSPITPLLHLKLGGPTLYIPKLATGVSGEPRWLILDEWKNRVVLATPDESSRFTAEQLILLLANKEGGAHIDGKLPPEYYALSRENSLGIRLYRLPWGGRGISYDDALGGQEVESPAPAAVRQLTFEVMWTLHLEFGLGLPRCVPNVDPLDLAAEWRSPRFSR